MKALVAAALGGLTLAVAGAEGSDTSVIAFTSFASEGLSDSPSDIVLVAPDGTFVRNLTPGGDGPGAPKEGQPAWSPDGTHIAFVSNRNHVGDELYVMRADGSDERRLTFGGGSSLSGVPSWSPSGSWIAFVKRRANSEDIFVIHPDGSGERQVTVEGGRKGFEPPAWSPDASRILYTTTSGETAALRVVDVHSAAGRTLFEGPFLGLGSATWSPDGSRVAFVASALTGRPAVLRIIEVATGHVRELLNAARGRPMWSPDGSEILVTASVGDRSRPWSSRGWGSGFYGFTDVYVVPVHGGAARRLTGMQKPRTPFVPEGLIVPMERENTDASWWPDGRRIFFRSDRDLRPGVWRELYVMNADGTCETRFEVKEATVLEGPAWRPGARPELPPLVCADVGLSVDERPSDPAGVGWTVPLLVEVSNDGNAQATSLRVQVNVSSHAKAIGASARNGSCTIARALSCSLAPLAPGSAESLRLILRTERPGELVATLVVSAAEMDGNAWNDRLTVRAGVLPCAVVGTPGADVFAGTPARDTICGRAGDDTVSASAGNDFVHGGSGADVLDGGAGRDTLLGYEGTDRVVGGPGRDWIQSGGRNDVVLVRDGEQDIVRCAAGNDRVIADPLDLVHASCERVIRGRA